VFAGTGRIHYTPMDDVHEGEQVITGTFFFKWTPHHHPVQFWCHSQFHQ
jgi:hypothetical protein